MKLRQWKNIFHVTVNANSIVQHVIQNENGIIKHGNVNVKIILNVENIIAEILAHVFVIIVFKKCCWYFNVWEWWNCTCYG